MRRRKMVAPERFGSGAPDLARPADPREAEVEREIVKIERMSLIELREAWLKRFGKAAPKLKGRDLLIRVLAFRLQADVFGDHSPEVKRKLAHLASVLAKDSKATLFPTPSLKPGIVLTREYRGVVPMILRLDPSACGAGEPADNNHQTFLDDLRARLASGSTIEWRRDDLVLTIPVRAKFRGGQNHITAPGIGAVNSFTQPDRALLKALVQAHAWLALLLRGTVQSIEELARYVGRDRPYVRRVLKLAFLSPSITADIVESRQPTFVSVAELLEVDVSLTWRMQAERLKA